MRRRGCAGYSFYDSGRCAGAKHLGFLVVAGRRLSTCGSVVMLVVVLLGLVESSASRIAR